METTFKKPIILVLVLVALVAVEGLPLVVQNINLGNIGNRMETKFNVLDFGAKPDGKTECAMNIQRAWIAACNSKGPARVIIPSGTYLANQIVFGGPCASKSPMVVQIDGILKGGIDTTEFYTDEWLLFENVNGLIVTGKGTLDGQGSLSSWKSRTCLKDDLDCGMSIASIKLNKVKQALVENIKSINSKAFHVDIMYSADIKLQKLHLTAPSTISNTDGIRISDSNNVVVSQSVIATGDECITIGKGSTNIDINQITCGPGNGISVVSPEKDFLGVGNIRGVAVKNCTLINTNNGVRIRSWAQSPPSAASAMVFQDITMINVQNPIIIDQEFKCSKVCNKPPSQVQINDVHFSNIHGTSVSPVAVQLKCNKKFPCQNIKLSNINLKYSGRPALPFTSLCTNAKTVYVGLQFPSPCK